MIKVKSFKKLTGNSKKYEITFEKNGKMYTRKFGATGMSDYTIHKDKERRERYISRHKKDLRTGDPMRPGYLSMYILWNKPSVKASLADYKRRLGVYNRTGKFPKGITGSKKLSENMNNKKPNSFGIPGVSIPFEDTSLRVLPEDIQQIIRNESIKRSGQNMDKQYLKNYLRNIKSKNVNMGKTDLNMVLDPLNEDTLIWLRLANNILTKKDFKVDSLWSEIIIHLLYQIIYTIEQNVNNLSRSQEEFYEANISLIETLVKKIYNIDIDFNDYDWAQTTVDDINELINSSNYFGKKRGSKIPHNVVNKKLYASIKAKIKRSIKGRRWGAYDSGRLVREYKAAGGKYKGPKGKTNLSRWYKEKWVDACAWPKRKSCGRKTKESIAYCRPSKKVDSKTPKLVQKLTAAQRKSRCARKKKTPMKRITKLGNMSFGQNQELLDKMRQQMFNQLMSVPDVNTGIQSTIIKRCFSDPFCQDIFTQLLLSMYFTIISKSKMTTNRQTNLTEMQSFIPTKFTPTMLNITKDDFSKIDKMLYLLQDHTYGNFKNARVASLIYEYIHQK